MAELLQELLAAERRVWDALVAGDAEADDRALDARFLGVYPDGFSDKADHMAQLDDGPTIAAYSLSEAQAIGLGNRHASLSYRADFTRCGREEGETMYVTSIWRRGARGWVNLLSQDTPAAPGHAHRRR
ncbi:MAG: nuclear transport factor 2 family protein [Pseudomonadota bacterium]